MTIIQQVTNAILEWLTAFWGFVSASITEAIGLFYDKTDGLTVLGILALFGVAVGVVYLGLNFVRSFFQK